MSQANKAILCASFDNMRSPQIRLLEEAQAFGPVYVYIWNDATIETLTGAPPKFPVPERLYYLESISYVEKVTPVTLSHPDELPAALDVRGTWVVAQDQDNPAKQAAAQKQGLDYQGVTEDKLASFPPWDPSSMKVEDTGNPKVLVTGCYDWFHTGHVRFFEEACEYGDLYVIVGHDANIEKLKGAGHPMFKEDERRYIVGSIRYVTQALVSTGDGWLDAEPEIKLIKPDRYVVNEDGDKSAKKEYCQRNGIEYIVLKRLPKEGLIRRESTQLRGF
ncbi:adenylyltransferase/cytidyltransferase family protein [Planctomycetota bacterium]